MRHGSIRWYGNRLDSAVVERFAMLGLRLEHPVNGRAFVLTENGRNEVEPDELRAELDASIDFFTFGLWLDHSTNTIVTASGSGEEGLNVFGLDGLDFEEQERVCAAVVWIAAHDARAKLIIGDDYLEDYIDDSPDIWDEYVAGRSPKPSATPKLLLERDESGRIHLEVPSR